MVAGGSWADPGRILGGSWADPGRIRGGTGAAFVDFGGFQVEGIDRVHDEVNDVALGNSVPQIGRK